MRPFFLCLILGSFSYISHTTAVAENWPCWRGPQGDGTSTETNVPVTWDGITGKNVAWKTAIPGVGHGSPIVWEDRILLVSCLEEQQQRILLCLDRTTGAILWQTVVSESILETKHRLNSYASGTPATDGKTIYVSFLMADGHEVPAPNVGTPRPVTPGEILVAAFDFDGQELWRATPGAFTSAHGFCSSPVIYEDLLIINGDHDGESFIAALDRATGKTVWKTPREHKTRSYCTPIIRDVAGRTQMVLSGSMQIVSLDPRTGSRFWHVEGPTEQFVASMVFDGRQFFMVAGYPTDHVMSIRPDGTGDVTDTHVAWHSTEVKCYVPSPVVVGKQLFVADDRGTANCYDTATGERTWRDRLGKHYSASLITANHKVYFLADDGITKVVQAGDAPEVIHENPLGEYAFASPAISSGQLFIRGEKHLFAIGQPQDDTSAN